MDPIKVGDTVIVSKGCAPRGVKKGQKATVLEIFQGGKEYSHQVKVKLQFTNHSMNGQCFSEFNRLISFWARHINRLSDEVINLNDGNPLHKIQVKRSLTDIR